MKAKQKKTQKSGWSSFFRERGTTITSGLAALVIIFVGFLLFTSANQNSPQANRQDSTGISTSSAQKATPSATPKSETKAQAPTPTPNKTSPMTVTYKVVAGDSLASIALKFYGNGDRWVDIARANKLSNPSKIHIGNVLVIPGISGSASSQAEAKPTQPNNKAESPQQTQLYTVVSGDTLWSIAENFYGSGFEWYRIRDANKSKIGTLPGGRPKVEPGTVLTIPLKQV